MSDTRPAVQDIAMRWLVVGTIPLVLAVMVAAQTKPSVVKPGKIFVGSMGTGDDADQLRTALGYELGRAGFKVVDFEPQADSVLTGLIVTRVDEGKSAKRVTTFLKDRRTGKMVWNQDFGSTYKGTNSSDGIIRQRALEIAKILKEDSTPKKTAKSHK
ncbi:MAG: hypothetical protein ACRD3E_03865 [Terriglobales bacterium]